MTHPAAKIEDFDHIACETMSYGAWGTGTRTIYKTKVPLWEEIVTGGHPVFGYRSQPRFTAWPEKLPPSLPAGAVSMDDSDPYFGAWIDFGANDLAAFLFCEAGNSTAGR